MSLFSTLVDQVNRASSSSEYHLIDNEYFAAFDNLNDVEQFHNNLNEKLSRINVNNDHDDNHNNTKSDEDDNSMDMKRFAQQFLIASPECLTKKTQAMKSNQQIKRKSIISTKSKMQRRTIKDLSQSDNYTSISDDDDDHHGNIFDSLNEHDLISNFKLITNENIDSILNTLDVRKRSITIKDEPIDQEQVEFVITHVSETKKEPIELNVIPTGPMGFGTSEYSDDLDTYVQNIHRSCLTNVSISNSPILRSKRIRKRKQFFNEDDQVITKQKRIRKRFTTQKNSNSTTMLTDAEIEQQFGERLSPLRRSDITVPIVHKTSIEQARANLTNALERGHGPDRYFLKIRSRESKMFEIELAIYGTADWHSRRVKIFSKIEEALRGLRVSWTKIDVRVDEFDIQICTSPHAASATPPLTLTNTNSSCFLKALSEFGPLIVHIHDRRYPKRRYSIKCPCSQCSSTERTIDTSLPVIVSVSSVGSSNRRLSPPTILRRPSQLIQKTMSSLHNIHTTFFNELIHQYGTQIISSVTQCVLDLTLIVSVHASLANLRLSNDEYQTKYRQVIDPLKYTINDNENLSKLKIYSEPDILTFYRNIKLNKANIRNAECKWKTNYLLSFFAIRFVCVLFSILYCQAMKTIIFNSIEKSSLSSVNHIKTTTLILPQQSINRRLTKRYRNYQMIPDNQHGMKQQAHFTPIIELKPIMSGDEINPNEPIRKITKLISTSSNDLKSSGNITNREITPRIIRLSITKCSSPSNSIRLIRPELINNKIELSTPLIPKQINIIKPLSTSITQPIKLANPVLISTKTQQSLIK